MSTERPVYGWTDFEPDWSTDAIPGKYVLTIVTLDRHGGADEEIATIVHRATEDYPLDGELMNSKRARAVRIVAALNAYTEETPL